MCMVPSRCNTRASQERSLHPYLRATRTELSSGPLLLLMVAREAGPKQPA